MKKTSKSRVMLLCALLLGSFLVLLIGNSFAEEVSIQAKNIAERFDRMLAPRFIPGYSLLEKSMVVKKGGGDMKGEATVSRVYFSKSAADLEKMTKEKKLTASDATKLIIKAEVFEKPIEAKKAAEAMKMDNGSFTGAPIGDAAWSSFSPKTTVEMVKEAEAKKKAEEEAKAMKGKPQPSPTPKAKPKHLTSKEKRALAEEENKKAIEQQKKDEELQKKLDADVNNYFTKNIVVQKRNIILRIQAINYQNMPSSEMLEELAAKILGKI